MTQLPAQEGGEEMQLQMFFSWLPYPLEVILPA